MALLVAHLPWWFTIAIVPVMAFSAWGWREEARLVLPVARRYLSGRPFEAGTMTTATRRPRGEDPRRGH